MPRTRGIDTRENTVGALIRTLWSWPGLSLIAVILLSGCTLTPPTGNPLDDELDELTALLVGDYYSDADGGAREGRAIYMRVREVPPPAGRRHALYAEMRHDGPAGEFYRQSIYVFDESTGRALNLMTALGVADRQAAARLVEDPSGLQRGDVQTTPQLAPGCEMAWTRTAEGFAGRIDPDRCQITGKRGDVRRIEAVTRISADAIGQLERGYAPDGTLLFGNADGALYRWPRVNSTGSQP